MNAPFYSLGRKLVLVLHLGSKSVVDGPMEDEHRVRSRRLVANVAIEFGFASRLLGDPWLSFVDAEVFIAIIRPLIIITIFLFLFAFLLFIFIVLFTILVASLALFDEFPLPARGFAILVIMLLLHVLLLELERGEGNVASAAFAQRTAFPTPHAALNVDLGEER